MVETACFNYTSLLGTAVDFLVIWKFSCLLLGVLQSPEDLQEDNGGVSEEPRWCWAITFPVPIVMSSCSDQTKCLSIPWFCLSFFFFFNHFCFGFTTKKRLGTCIFPRLLKQIQATLKSGIPEEAMMTCAFLWCILNVRKLQGRRMFFSNTEEVYE